MSLLKLNRQTRILSSAAMALTLAMVWRGESFDRAPVLLQSTPHPSPLPKEREPVVAKTPPFKPPQTARATNARWAGKLLLVRGLGFNAMWPARAAASLLRGSRHEM